MENGSYLRLSRQVYAFDHLNVISNNIAQTAPGSKQDFVLATKKVIQDKDDKLSFPQGAMTMPDWSAGPIKMTYRDWDLAIESYGDEHGFFTVSTPQGLRYTRNGSFRLDDENRLVDSRNNPVVSVDGQEIVLEATDGEAKVMSNGTILVNNEERGNVGIISFNPRQMRLLNKTPDGYFHGDVEGTLAQEAKIIQGGLEEANGSTVANLALLISLQRETGMISRLEEEDHNMKRNAYRSIAQLSS